MVSKILNNLTGIYWYIAVFSTIFFVIKLALFSIFGGDVEVHADFNASFETETSFDFISIQSILAFLMGFGWFGLTCLKQWHLSTWLTLLLSAIFGLILMTLSAYLMSCIKKLNKTVKKDKTTCVGQMAKAYTNFAPNGIGQIEVDIEGQLSIENAINTTDKEIKSFSQVKILKYENNTFYVE